MIHPRFSGAQDLVDSLRAVVYDETTAKRVDEVVSALLVRLDAAEDVIRAAKGRDSTARTVEALDAYEGAYGLVAGEYGEPGSDA